MNKVPVVMRRVAASRTYFLSLASILLILLAGRVAAADVRFGGVRLDLPAQFSGPVRATPDASSETIVYMATHQGGSANEIVQLTRYDFGSKIPPNLSEKDLEKGANQYLLQMLEAIHRARSDYSQTPPQQIRLAGRIGAESSWTGALQGIPSSGRMYCLIVGTQVVIIHAFGPGSVPSKDRESAVLAIEALRLDQG